MGSYSTGTGLRRRVRVRRPFLPLFCLVALVAPCAAQPEFADAAALERFILGTSDEDLKRALETALTLDGAGKTIDLAAKLGPEYAKNVSNLLPDPGFRQGYTDLALDLELFGPCQKQMHEETEGWWSSYSDPPSKNYCGEVTKILFAALLWNQVHYCGRLVTGEDKPKIPVPSRKLPPYRLDEPPVATHWIHADALYAITDAATRFDFAKTLRERAVEAPDRVRAAMLTAAAELDRGALNREMASLAIAKLLIRRYEQRHLEHLARVNAEHAPAAK